MNKKLILLSILILCGILVLFPLGVVLITSIIPVGMNLKEAVNQNHYTWNNYQEAWQQGDFILAFTNSTIVAIAVTVFQIITSTTAGYALSRLSFTGRNSILLLVLATLVIPFQLLVIPIFLILKIGNLINTYWALILPTAASGYSIFLMRQFFLTIPIELEEAALLDGANRFQILWNILLPLSRPALVTLFLISFIAEWNDLFKPLVFTTRPELRTVQLAVAAFQEEFTNSWSVLMAVVVIVTLPIIILFLFGQKQFIRGIGTTGLKN
ncbi:carbohydrate ABC transporter permease [Chroococcus sp. FPU101]|uniref:carbohydrate ABC transporter permease n=1 Tax=Chroococcus sp. FPU101 TaxID=1974212 RepID=UPI001A8F3BA3|nr:carbohydrate ABC transporter permease [Chroococcus sp. FPU101]GFE70232.1 ABC transporter sugar permease [Chroococcus sp. FPU101]